jgi:uncharacterized protein (DUF488 family)
MKANNEKTIWTIGHSTRSYPDFVSLLKQAEIRMLVDVRAFPGSRKYPQFNSSELEQSLHVDGIQYKHMPELGGRRKPKPDSHNTEWRNESFRGYADYMETEEFVKAIVALEALAVNTHVAYMCSESVWWRCHRALISDSLKIRGWLVLHILEKGKIQEHPFTTPARDRQGKIFPGL